MQITENDVVKAVAVHLKSAGYVIERMATTDQKGVDIISMHPKIERKLYVEAKGGTSSKEGTNRFGKEFTPNQIKSHVSVALYSAAYHYQTADDKQIDLALAFPDDSIHRKLVTNISKALKDLNIRIFFVQNNLTVKVFDLDTSTQQVGPADARDAAPRSGARG